MFSKNFWIIILILLGLSLIIIWPLVFLLIDTYLLHLPFAKKDPLLSQSIEWILLLMIYKQYMIGIFIGIALFSVVLYLKIHKSTTTSLPVKDWHSAGGMASLRSLHFTLCSP